MRQCDLVLSFGDLVRQSGYRTRVLGELHHIEHGSPLEPLLLAFDRAFDRGQGTAVAEVPAWYGPRDLAGCHSEIMRVCREFDVRIVHAHNLYSAALAISLRPFAGYSVLLDLHGRIPEEYVYLGKGGTLSRRGLEGLERWCVRRSDHIIAVSHTLKRYLTDRYAVGESAVSVIPDCADPRFRWDADERTRQRGALGLDDRFLCLHLGSFSEWYQPDTIVRIFSSVRERIRNAHLLVVTADQAGARRALSGQLSEDQYTVTSAPHETVPAFLNAADLGFLILPDTPNIRTSSPTKFAEYVNCGLPVAISPNVGDFTAMVDELDLGCVVDDDPAGPHTDLPEWMRAFSPGVRERIAGNAVTLRWEAFRSVWTQIIEGIPGLGRVRGHY